MDQGKARQLLADAEIVHDADAVQAALEVVAGKIRTQLADKNPLVLCVMTGGVVFCGQLLPKLVKLLPAQRIYFQVRSRKSSLAALARRSAQAAARATVCRHAKRGNTTQNPVQ